MLEELKRRHVFRVALAYVVVSWLVMQVADVILNNIEAPDWVFKVILLMLGIGFVLTLVLSWAFEVRPENHKLKGEVDRNRPITPPKGRKLNRIITAAIVVAVGYFAFDALTAKTSPGNDEIESVSLSIAVLPFVNISPDPDQEYFSDGVSEEILNVLAKIPELQVAARSSAFQFKGQNRNIVEIGQLLNVGNVLEGSVRKVGNRVRITAQLIEIQDGFHIWSDTFDRELTDIFAIQDEIAEAIATAMRTTLNLQAPPSGNLTGTTSLEAYEFFLQGIQKWHLREAATLREAERLFLASAEVDPGFAKAHAGLALTYSIMASYLQEPEGPYRLRTRRAAERALEIDPRNVEALTALIGSTEDLQESIRLFDQTISINPSFATAYQWHGSNLVRANRLEDAIRMYRRAFELDPRGRIIGNNLAGTLLANGQTDEALAVLGSMESFAPDYNENLEMEFVIRLIRGELEQAKAVGKKLALALNKRISGIELYLSLLGPRAGRIEAADSLLSWPRGTRLDPDSPVLIYEHNLTLLLAHAGAYEQAIDVLPYVIQSTASMLGWIRSDVGIGQFNGRTDVRDLYEQAGLVPVTSADSGGR